MSLEKAIQDLTIAVSQNTEIQEKLLEALTSGATAKTETTAKKASGKKASAKKASAKKAKTSEDLRKLYGGYLSQEKDKAGKTRLNATVKPILEHFGCYRITEIDGDDIQKAYEYGVQLKEAYDEGGLDAAEALELDFMTDNDAGDEEEEEDDVL